jgi:hypothetical protein
MDSFCLGVKVEHVPDSVPKELSPKKVDESPKTPTITLTPLKI